MPPSNMLGGAWRKNPSYEVLGLSADAQTALDSSEREEAAIAKRLRAATAEHRAAMEAVHAAADADADERRRQATLSDAQLRDELRTAIARQAKTERCAQVTQTAVANARMRVAEAQAHLASFWNLDGRITEWTVAQVRQGHRHEMPDDLKNARRDAISAEDALELVQDGVRALEGELVIARAQADAAATARDRAAVAVISRHLDHVAKQLNAAMDAANKARQELLSATAVWVPLAGAAMPLPVSDAVRVVLRRGVTAPPNDENVKAGIRSWFSRLVADADAALVEMP
jgi:hypothetical protein